jgi:phage terminase large subunit-like protein
MTDDLHGENLGRMAAEIAEASERAKRYRRIDYWRAYPKQEEFFAATLNHREVGLFAATQSGKTESAAFLMAYHLTGIYPPQYRGRRFDKPIKAWVVGENLKMVRDVCQKKLCGEPGDMAAWGSGTIPRDSFVGDPVLARGEGLAFDTVQVRRISGGVSTLRFRTYNAGRSALQGETLDWVWLDEEPEDFAVYSECLARISGTGGGLVITFTPLLGMSSVSTRFREEKLPDRTFVQYGIDDIPVDGHISPPGRQRIIEGYPEHEREARSKGIPMLGEGRVYKTPEEQIIEEIDPLTLPSYWRWGAAIDIGLQHPFAYELMCWDVDQDVIHLIAELRMSDTAISGHVAAVRNLEKRVFGRHMNFPTSWPHDGNTRDKGSGEPLKEIYKRYGLRMMAEHASHAGLHGAAAYSLEGGVAEIDARERAGKWKISRGMLAYLEERRLYHRKDGEIVKLRDDTLSAARYGLMMKRYFRCWRSVTPAPMWAILLQQSGGHHRGRPDCSNLRRESTSTCFDREGLGWHRSRCAKRQGGNGKASVQRGVS